MATEKLAFSHDHHPILVGFRKPQLASSIQVAPRADMEELHHPVATTLPLPKPVSVQASPTRLVGLLPEMFCGGSGQWSQFETGQNRVSVEEGPGPLDVVKGVDGSAFGRDHGPLPPARYRMCLFLVEQEPCFREAVLYVPYLYEELGVGWVGKRGRAHAEEEHDDQYE
jgi:hypothetical protein